MLALSLLLLVAVLLIVALIAWSKRRTDRVQLLGKPHPSTRRDAFNDTPKGKPR